jgi:hypothetical protein
MSDQAVIATAPRRAFELERAGLICTAFQDRCLKPLGHPSLSLIDYNNPVGVPTANARLVTKMVTNRGRIKAGVVKTNAAVVRPKLDLSSPISTPYLLIQVLEFGARGMRCDPEQL